PSLGLAIGCARVHPDDSLTGHGAAPGQQLPCRRRIRVSYPDVDRRAIRAVAPWRVRQESRAREDTEIVVDLMDLEHVGVDLASVSKKQTSTVARVAQSLGNARPPRDQGGLHRVLKKYRQVESPLSNLVQDFSQAAPALVCSTLVILDNLVNTIDSGIYMH